MGQLTILEFVPLILLLILWAGIIGVAVWVVVTLKRIRDKVDAIEQLLLTRKDASN